MHAHAGCARCSQDRSAVEPDQRVEASAESADGWRLRFSPDAWPVIAETIEAERQCCRFLRFEAVVEPDGGPIWLTLSGPPGTREFLSDLLQK